MFLALLLGALAAAGPAPAVGQRLSSPPLQPRTHASSTGRWELDVEPSHRLGEREASYRLRRDGQQIWSGVLEVTLREAAVAEDGSFGGVAYSRGPEWIGELCVLVVGPDGALRGDHRVRRRQSGRLHGLPIPVCSGVFLQHGILVARIRGIEGEPGEVWWRVRLADGERLKDGVPASPFEPDERGGVGGLVDVTPIPGIELAFGLWSVYREGERRTAFCLLRADGRLAWQRSVVPVPDAAPLRATSPFGALLEGGEGGAFAYWSALEGVRVDMTARHDETADTWIVEERARTPARAPATARPAAETLALPRAVELEALEPVQLGEAVEREERALDRVQALALREGGGVELVGFCEGQGRYVELDASGTIAYEAPLAASGDLEVRWEPGSAGTWWRAQRARDGDSPSIQRFDMHSGEIVAVREIEGERLPPMAGDGRGGLVFVSGGVLVALDPQGRERWAVGASDARKELRSTSELVVAGERAVVLSRFLGRLFLYDIGDGSVLPPVDLEQAWGRKPQYPAGLVPSGPDAVLVGDDGVWWRTSRGGELLGVLEPRLEDGQLVDSARFATTPEGELWGWSHRHRTLLRFDAMGIGRPFGSELPAIERLGRPLRTCIDAFGRILVQDEATGAIHAFNAAGERLFVASPAPDDFPRQSFLDPLTVDGAGHIYAPTQGRELLAQHRHVRFDEHGERVGFVSLGSGAVHFVPGSEARWEREWGEGYRRREADGSRGPELLRRADGRWFTSTPEIALATDGSLATLVLGSQEAGEPLEGVAVSFYEADATPRFLEWIAAPIADACLSPGWLFARSGTKGLLFSLEEREWLSFDLGFESDQQYRWSSGFSPDGSEIWLLEPSTLTLYRWLLPG